MLRISLGVLDIRLWSRDAEEKTISLGKWGVGWFSFLRRERADTTACAVSWAMEQPGLFDTSATVSKAALAPRRQFASREVFWREPSKTCTWVLEAMVGDSFVSFSLERQ